MYFPVDNSEMQYAAAPHVVALTYLSCRVLAQGAENSLRYNHLGIPWIKMEPVGLVTLIASSIHFSHQFK